MIWVRAAARVAVLGRGMVLAAGLLAVAVPAVANDVDDCFEKFGDAAIAACTRAITPGQATGPSLAKIYYSRAVNRHDLRDLDAAIADYGEAINIDPSFTAAYTGRALAYEKKG